MAARASSTFSRCDIVSRSTACVTFWAVYVTPDGSVADRVWSYSDHPHGPR